MLILLILDGLLFLFTACVAGYVAARISKRSWLGWLIGAGVLYWLMFWVPYEFC